MRHPNHTRSLLGIRLGRDFGSWLAERRADGESLRSIEQTLHELTGITISRETLRRWHIEASPDKSNERTSA